MSNLSYCRFQNAASDLSDCVNNLRSLDPNDNSYNVIEERDARARIIRLAAMILEECGISDPSDSHEIDDMIEELNQCELEGSDYDDE